jgi:hypothetical protein
MKHVFRILALSTWIAGVACTSSPEVLMPCPKPAFTLDPQVDTIAVGETLQYETAFPNQQPVSQSGLQWSSSDSQNASVDQRGVATGRARGSVQVHALDPNSPPTCPDQWYGTLVVQ